jgi:uncharacterized protein YjbJ (UPF0337 family)
MDWNRVEGNWKEMKGKVKEQWGKLTDDDLDVIDGRQDQLEGRLQQRYGYAKDQAKKEVNACSTAKNGDGLAEEKSPGSPGLFFTPRHIQLSVHESRHCSHCAILHIRLPHLPATPAECRRKSSFCFRYCSALR